MRPDRFQEADGLEQRRAAAIGALMTGIVHEANTPLQCLLNNLHFLRDCVGQLDPARSGPPAEWREEVETVLDESREALLRVVALVNAISDFMRAPAGSPGLVDLNLTVGAVLALTRNEWKYSARVDTALADGLPPVVAEPARLGMDCLDLVLAASRDAAASASVTGQAARILVATRAGAGGADLVVEVEPGGARTLTWPVAGA